MKILEGITQGSDQWRAIRRQHFCASDAAAAMGLSKYKSRSELLREKATGASEEIDPAKQRLFDSGHAAEAAARGIVEGMLCEELYPATVTAEVDGLPLLASLDGLTMAGDIIWETKLFNSELWTAVDNCELDPHYWAQIEHQLLVTGAEKAYFTVSDGTPERTRGMWYVSTPQRRAQVLGAWKQLATDLAAYQHVEVLPAAVAAPIEDLPALTVELVGQVKNSNLVSFKAAVMARIQAINTDLQTDDDFATADKMVKFLDDGESRLDLVKSQALAQTSSIDELFRTIDALKGEMRAKRLTLNNLVKARKESIREEIRREDVEAASVHIAGLNKRLGQQCMPVIQADFAGAMKGKKTITSLRDAVATELARFKIEANAMADRIQININVMRELGVGKEFLFADVLQIIVKANDDFEALCKNRIAEHKEKEQKREADQRERIRLEELAKIEAERVAAEKKAADNSMITRNPAPDAAPPSGGNFKTFTVGHAEAAQPAPAKPAVTMVKGTVRPTDEAIIEVLALHFRVVDATVIRWLMEMDLDATTNRLIA